MRPKRFALALLVAAFLVPGTLLRTPEPPHDFKRLATVTPLAVTAAKSGPFTLAGAWEMTGDRVFFGGWSALVRLDEQRFLAGSDGGRRLVFERPDRSELPGVLDRFGADIRAVKESRDLESLAIDPETGTVWAGYEFRQSIARFDKEFKVDGEVRPAAMRDWDGNGGPEALVRFADGRFLVIEESPTGWSGDLHDAILFAGDPIEGAEASRLTLAAPAGYRPVDAAPVEAGLALVLLRKVVWSVPVSFDTALALVDIEERDTDGNLQARLLAEFGERIPRDNYEGIALTEDADGRHVWLISDDNFMSFQRTLLLKLRWHAREKARE